MAIYVDIILHSPRFLLGCLRLFGKIITSSDPNPDTLFWHSFWHAVWKYVSHILYIYIYSDILSDNLSRIYSDIPAGIYCDILSGIPKTTFYLASIIFYYDMLFGILPLTFYLAFYHILSDKWSNNLSGILPELVSVTWSNDKWSTQQIRCFFLHIYGNPNKNSH